MNALLMNERRLRAALKVQRARDAEQCDGGRDAEPDAEAGGGWRCHDTASDVTEEHHEDAPESVGDGAHGDEDVDRDVGLAGAGYAVGSALGGADAVE